MPAAFPSIVLAGFPVLGDAIEMLVPAPACKAAALQASKSPGRPQAQYQLRPRQHAHAARASPVTRSVTQGIAAAMPPPTR